jgi:acyl-coenzyme A thioesterase 9
MTRASNSANCVRSKAAMATSHRLLQRLLRPACGRATLSCSRLGTVRQLRPFHSTMARGTIDGVFTGLTDGRLPMPWIEALRLQQEGKNPNSPETQPQERDLTLRKMSDSYHRVVLPLGQDPQLSDTYLNASGHIRYGVMTMMMWMLIALYMI